MADDITKKEPETPEEIDAELEKLREEHAALGEIEDQIQKDITDATKEDAALIDATDLEIDQLEKTAEEEERQGGMGAAREEIEKS